MFSLGRMLINDWRRMYRHRGGLRALVRCIQGSYGINRGAYSPTEQELPGVDCITFSVIPKMTSLWAKCLPHAVATRPLRVWIGDCSGTLGACLPDDDVIRVMPLLNYHHGDKLDLFLKHFCRTEYVIVSDDDIFWLDPSPWKWAYEQLTSDPSVAVVSLLPFKHMLEVLRGKVPHPMGSCFVIRRKTWIDEVLSFKIDRSPRREGKWIYDTGAKAQEQLVERGYRIIYAPDEIQSRFEAFDGMSSWMLKIQKQNGNIFDNLEADKKIRPQKAIRAIFAARGLASMSVGESCAESLPDLVASQSLDRAAAACGRLLSQEAIDLARLETGGQIDRIRSALNSWKTPNAIS